MPEPTVPDTTVPAGGTPTPTPAAPWYQGNAAIDASLTTKWQEKGWKTDTAADIAIAATRGYIAAEGLIGAKPEEMVRLPKDALSPEWNGVWQKLGRPVDAKGYDLAGVKFADGAELDDGFADFIRETAFNLNLPAAAAKGLAERLAKFTDGADAREASESAAALANEKTALAKNWGANHAQNMLVAQNAVRALGLDPAVVNTLEGVVGYSKVMEMFRNIGSRIGEDKYIGTQGLDGGKGVMTLDQAKARKAELYKDSDFVKKYLAGGADQKREMTALDTIISSGRVA